MSQAVRSATTIQGTIRDYLELSKARIVLMVLITTAAGFVIARPSSIDFVLLIHALIGTAFVAAGTNALNQYMERELDGLMARTRSRPLPDGRMTERGALAFSVLISVFGVTYLAVVVTVASSVLALTTLVTYLFIYTPLKQRTTLCTLIGAGPGAIPPMVGWAAATGTLEPGAWVLFSVLFLWQMPHFFAIGWIYRHDYAKAGFSMLSLRDDDGRESARQAVFFATLLVPVSLLAPLVGIGSIGYAAGALALGILFVGASIQFARERSNRNARTLFMVSNLYLVVMMSLLVVATLV